MTTEEIKKAFQDAGYSVRRDDTGDKVRGFTHDKVTYTDNEWHGMAFTKERAEAVKQALETLYNTIGLTFTVSLEN